MGVLMNNILKIYDVTDKIKRVYSKLFYLDKKKQLGEEYNCLLEVLKEILIKEDQLYKDLTSKDIMIMFEQIKSKIKNNKEKVHKNTYIFDKTADNYDLIIERIKIRLSIYVEMYNLGDNDWYKNIYNGLYLTDNTDISKENKYYYYFIYSSWSIINYKKNTTSNYYQPRYLFLNKYINSFLDPFSETVLVRNNFKMDNDYKSILKLNSYNSQFIAYMDAAQVFYEINIKNFVNNVLYGKIKEFDTYFVDLLIGTSSFLEIINEDMREQIYMECVNTYRMSGTTSNICTEYLFELFNHENYNKDTKKTLKKRRK